MFGGREGEEEMGMGGGCVHQQEVNVAPGRGALVSSCSAAARCALWGTRLCSPAPQVDAAGHAWLLTASRCLARVGRKRRERVSGLHTTRQVLQHFLSCFVLTYFPLCLNKTCWIWSFSCLEDRGVPQLAGWGCSLAVTRQP